MPSFRPYHRATEPKRIWGWSRSAGRLTEPRRQPANKQSDTRPQGGNKAVSAKGAGEIPHPGTKQTPPLIPEILSSRSQRRGSGSAAKSTTVMRSPAKCGAKNVATQLFFFFFLIAHKNWGRDTFKAVLQLLWPAGHGFYTTTHLLSPLAVRRFGKKDEGDTAALSIHSVM